MREKVGAAGLYLLAGAALIKMSRSVPEMEPSPLNDSWLGYLLGLALPVLFFACIRAFFNLRFSCWLGLAATASAMPWFIETERMSMRWAGSSSWVALNL